MFQSLKQACVLIEGRDKGTTKKKSLGVHFFFPSCRKLSNKFKESHVYSCLCQQSVCQFGNIFKLISTLLLDITVLKKC